MMNYGDAALLIFGIDIAPSRCSASSFTKIPQYIMTHGAPEIFMVLAVVVLLPLVYFSVIRPAFPEGKRGKAVWIFLAGSVLVAYGDVVVIGLQAYWLCTHEAGLRVFKTVEADGYLSAFGAGDDDAKKGFKYIESEPNALTKWRNTWVNGKVVRESISEFKSKYEFAVDKGRTYFCCTRARYVTRNRKTGDVLGQLQSFAIRSGWLDDALWSRIAEYVPILCEEPGIAPSQKNSAPIDGLLATIHPTKD